MKLALIGQSAFGKSILEKLSDRAEHEIVGVFAAPDTRRSREPLAAAADELELPVWQFNRMRDQECIDVFRALDADLCVMAYVTDIVPNEMIDAPIHGTIQYHPSLLPLHRGPSSINWAIINGDAETGLSIFWPDEGLDTGPILLQKRVDIGPDDSVGSLYFNHLYPMGIEAILESIDLVARWRSTAHCAGRVGGNIRRLVRNRRWAHRLGTGGIDSPQPDSRLRSATRSVVEAE